MIRKEVWLFAGIFVFLIFIISEVNAPGISGKLGISLYGEGRGAFFGNTSFGMIRGFTSGTYNGNLNAGGYVGYPAGNYICNQEYPNSHFCTQTEVLETIASGNYTTATGTAWLQKGAPGYTANSNDCNGWTTSSNTYLGPFWDWDASGTQAGAGYLTNCAQLKPLMCCGGD